MAIDWSRAATRRGSSALMRRAVDQRNSTVRADGDGPIGIFSVEPPR